MGKGSEGISANYRKSYEHGSCEAHDVSGGSAQDRGGTTGAMGEAPGEEGGVTDSDCSGARCFGGRFSKLILFGVGHQLLMPLLQRGERG